MDENASIDRIEVVGSCAAPCPSCVACRPREPAALAEVLASDGPATLILGGGDATAWPHLHDYLHLNAGRERPQEIWLEAPARSLTDSVLEDLHARGVAGVRVQIEASGEKMCAALGVGDGERVIERAEALGMATRALLCIRPKTFAALFGLAKRLAPRSVEIELVRNDWGEQPIPIWPDMLAGALREVGNVKFSATRMSDRGYLPPCALPEIWDSVPSVWRGTLSEGDREMGAAANRALEACGSCSLADRCRFSDVGALPDPDAVRPIAGDTEPWLRRGATEQPVPAHIVAKRPEPPVVCTTPWTTMEIVDPDGKVRQCCSDWTVGERGNVHDATLSTIWNGEGYRSARRIMSGADLAPLCRAICSRLYDEKFAESELRIFNGSDRFVANQLLMAEEIAGRAETMRAKPVYMSLCPSTYCNYDCIMCLHGRTPRRELPDSIWEELPEFLPTLRSLTLLGGEPLADPRTMTMLREFDVAKYPDTAIDIITNASLLTRKTLSHLQRCTFGDVTVSLNAGTPETYEKVQRGLSLEVVLDNLDALLEFRAGHHRWFGITLSFVVQPEAIDSLMEFAEIARARNLPIRLMALNTGLVPELDFYLDPDRLAHVTGRLDRFIDFCRRSREDWLSEAMSARQAVAEEARNRQAAAASA